MFLPNTRIFTAPGVSNGVFTLLHHRHTTVYNATNICYRFECLWMSWMYCQIFSGNHIQSIHVITRLNITRYCKWWRRKWKMSHWTEATRWNCRHFDEIFVTCNDKFQFSLWRNFRQNDTRKKYMSSIQWTKLQTRLLISLAATLASIPTVPVHTPSTVKMTYLAGFWTSVLFSTICKNNQVTL